MAPLALAADPDPVRRAAVVAALVQPQPQGRGGQGGLSAGRGEVEAAVAQQHRVEQPPQQQPRDRKSTRLNSSHVSISYAVFCLKKKNIMFGPLVAKERRCCSRLCLHVVYSR